MNKINNLREAALRVKRNLEQNTLDSLLYIVNILPNMVGFSILKKEGKAVSVHDFPEPFWIIHLGLLAYVYALGSLVYQIKYAQGSGDFIKSYVNISLLILTANNSYWFITKRPLLRKVLKKVFKNDEMAQHFSLKRHRELLAVIKKMLLIFYGFNVINEFCVYLPNRTDVIKDNYSMTFCVGIEPLWKSPKREICQVILSAQEISIMIVVLNYQALLMILFAHTAAMYTLMAEEMFAFVSAESSNGMTVKERLASLIRRHSLTLGIINDLKLLYSMPIGVNFGTNAVCICLFFYLPFQEWTRFMPILGYCFLVFFLYCFLGQRLVNASELFEMSVYCCGWENFDLNEMKMVYVMLLQAQRPIELLAADIIPVNIYTFATLLQGIFKFITVVKF